MESMTLEELERKALEKEKTYKKENGDYVCGKCGTDILAVTVTFSIHDAPFRLADSGKTQKQVFPYCPKCESRPDIRGIPINIKQSV